MFELSNFWAVSDRFLKKEKCQAELKKLKVAADQYQEMRATSYASFEKSNFIYELLASVVDLWMAYFVRKDPPFLLNASRELFDEVEHLKDLSFKCLNTDLPLGFASKFLFSN